MQLMSSGGERVFDFSFIFDCYKTWGEIFSQSQSFALENQNNGKKKNLDCWTCWGTTELRKKICGPDAYLTSESTVWLHDEIPLTLVTFDARRTSSRGNSLDIQLG